jgi:FixJ family two-component response regulator
MGVVYSASFILNEPLLEDLGMAGRPLTPLTLSAADRSTLERWNRRPTTAQALALRARIVLRAADGASNVAIADELGVSKQTVCKWRGRFDRSKLSSRVMSTRSGMLTST